MTHSEIASYRLYNQQISGPGRATAAEVVHWMGAVQAQDYLASLWAIGLRTPRFGAINEQGVEQAMDHQKPTTPSLHLLPAFDEILCGYKDRSAVLTTDYLKTIILKNGILLPTIIIDGKVAGSWKRTLKKEKAEIRLEIFPEVDFNRKVEMNNAVAHYGAFLGIQAEIKVG